MKKFNTTGVCIPQRHYMVDVTSKAEQIVAMIDEGEYFTINQAWQYGKTSMLAFLEETLEDRYRILSVSFQGASEEPFSSALSFANFFLGQIEFYMNSVGYPDEMMKQWCDRADLDRKEWRNNTFMFLRQRISTCCSASDRPVILMIDEVDSASNNDVFLSFLGMLRENYLSSRTRRRKKEASFQSVILASVTDIKNLKIKIRPDGEHILNSPWNIAADFNVDMSFSTEEIAGMLREYEADHHSGMDISAVSREIRHLTSGYPYLVSWICRWLDEGGGPWSADGVHAAGEAFAGTRKNALIDSIRTHILNIRSLRKLVIQMIFFGAEIPYNSALREVDLGIMYGLFANGGGNRLVISNPLFEKILFNCTADIKRQEEESLVQFTSGQFIQGNSLNMEQVLNRFQAFLNSEHRDDDSRFVERECRLLFLAFLRPIINGTGRYYVEPETRNNRRMDIIVSYGMEEFIVELKIWDGAENRRDGIRQLEDYMDSREAETAYLLSFSFLKKKDVRRNGWVPPEETSKRIYEVTAWVQSSGEAEEVPPD